MSGSDEQTQTQTQNTKSEPWLEAQPLLKNMLAKLGGVSTDITGGQSSALDALKSAVGSIPQFGNQAAGAISRLFGSDTSGQVGMLSGALDTLRKNIGGTASGAELDPYKTPGFGDALSTVMGDITDRVKGVYNASGRAPSGAGSFAGSLGRGLTEGISPMLMGQSNTNKTNQMNAANTLFGGEQGTAGQITSQNQVPLTNAIQGMGMLPQLIQAFTGPAAAQMGLADTEQGMGLANIMKLLNPAMMLGGLGGTSSGTSTGTVTQPQSMFSNIMGGLTGGAGLLSLMGGSGGGMAALAPLLALSDERAKDDVESIGMLNDGQNVVRFRYKGEPKTHIGVIAQDVAAVEPDAVYDMGGMLMVDHKRATDRAAEMGRAA